MVILTWQWLLRAHYNEPDYSLVFANDGTGRFSRLAAMYPCMFDVVWVDVNVDGFLIVFANAQSPHTLYLSEQGTLSQAPDWAASEGPLRGIPLIWGCECRWLSRFDHFDNNQLGGLGTVRLCGPDLEPWWCDEGSKMWSAVSIYDVDDDATLTLAGAWGGEGF